MKATRLAKLFLCSTPVLLLRLLSSPAHAQGIDPDKIVSLRACNNSNMRVDAITSWADSDRNWHVLGWLQIPARGCANIDAQVGAATPVDLGFAYTDASGEWGSVTASVPDYGTNSRGAPVFSHTDRQICVRRGDTMYLTDDPDRAKDCASLELTNDPEGSPKFFAFPTTLHFQPDMKKCPLLGPCTGGDYAIEIAPLAQGHALTAKRGLTDEERGWQIIGNFLTMLAKAGQEERENQQQAAATTAESQLQQARQASAARDEANQRIKAAAAAGDRAAQAPAQMIAREEENNRQRWAGTQQTPAAYDPQWMGKNMVIVGTVSRIEVDPDGSPQWLTIHFKESPNSDFVVCSPYPDMFQERVGRDLNVLVGKTLRAAGQVESPYCGGNAPKGSIRIVESTQWQIQ